MAKTILAVTMCTDAFSFQMASLGSDGGIAAVEYSSLGSEPGGVVSLAFGLPKFRDTRASGGQL